MKVKDVEVLFNNMYDFDHRVIGEFYGENDIYIGQIDISCDAGFIWISDKLRTFWESKVKILRVYTVQNTTIFTFMVMKGVEK
jgi:hypothetical protein